MSICVFSDPNTLFNKPNTDPPENGSAKYTPLPNGTVDSKAGVVTPCTKGSILRGDIFMYQEAKAKRQRLLRAHEKKRDRLAQVSQRHFLHRPTVTALTVTQLCLQLE